MTVNDHASQERYVALYAWLCGQMSPRTPHAADLFAQDSECLYDAFLSVLIGTGLGFIAYDDIRFVASVIASVATLELVADVRVDECVFECELPREYARFTANKPWEDGSLLIGALDSSLLVPGPLIHLEARPRYKGQALSPSGFTEALASAVQMGLSVESSSAFAFGAAATLRAPHGGPEMLGWAADAVARALSACGYTGVAQIRARFAHAPE